MLCVFPVGKDIDPAVQKPNVKPLGFLFYNTYPTAGADIRIQIQRGVVTITARGPSVTGVIPIPASYQAAHQIDLYPILKLCARSIRTAPTAGADTRMQTQRGVATSTARGPSVTGAIPTPAS